MQHSRRREPHFNWPHFDPRGPEYYYEDDPRRPFDRGRDFPRSNDRPERGGEHYNLRPERNQWWNEWEVRQGPLYRDLNSGRYDRDEYSRNQSYQAGPWPEDDFQRYRQGRFLREDDPRAYRHEDEVRHHTTHYPADYHDHGYGSDIHSYNGNRSGRGQRGRRREW